VIPAYHWVPKEAFHEISSSGHIIPASERLDPKIFQDKCAGELENLAYTLKGQPVDPIAWMGLGKLLGDRLEDFATWSPGSPYTFTQLGCIDLLALDAESVFLQVGQWPMWAGRNPSGFVFDAEELIRRGVFFREKDLAIAYWAGLQKVVLRKFPTVDDAETAIVSMFSDVQKKYDKTGAAAAKALKKRRRESEPAELLWHGRLPVSLAIDWIYEGETQRA